MIISINLYPIRKKSQNIQNLNVEIFIETIFNEFSFEHWIKNGKQLVSYMGECDTAAKVTGDDSTPKSNVFQKRNTAFGFRKWNRKPGDNN